MRDGSHELESSNLPEFAKKALMALGYVTTEQVASAAKLLGEKLTHYAGVDLEKLLQADTVEVEPAQVAFKIKSAVYRHGAKLRTPIVSALPRASTFAPAMAMMDLLQAPAAAIANPSVNMISEMQTIRDQAFRGTCVAHAAVACLEHAVYKQSGAQTDFSEQFAYWNAKQNDGIPTQEGTFLTTAMPLLLSDGCCVEPVWPYAPNPVPGDEGQGPPPGGALADAATHKATAVHRFSSSDIVAIKAELAASRCVAVAVAYYADAWESLETRATGQLTLPLPGETTHDGHAVCLVGYEDLPDNEPFGGGRFLFRNSWNSYWANPGEFGIGYGTMPYSYLATYGSEAYSLE